MKRFRIILLCAVALMLPVYAQEETTPQSIKLRTMGWERIKKDVYLKQGAGANTSYLKLSLLGMCPSIETKLKVRNSLELYMKSGSDEEPVYKQVARTKLPSNCKRFLLIVFPQNKKTSKFPVRVIKDDPSSSPMGSYRIYNFTSKKLTVGVGKLATQISPKRDKLFKPKAAHKEQIPFAAWYHEGDKKVRVASNSWFFNKKKHLKYFIMFKKDARGRYRAKYKALADYNKKPKPKRNR